MDRILFFISQRQRPQVNVSVYQLHCSEGLLRFTKWRARFGVLSESALFPNALPYHVPGLCEWPNIYEPANERPGKKIRTAVSRVISRWWYGPDAWHQYGPLSYTDYYCCSLGGPSWDFPFPEFLWVPNRTHLAPQWCHRNLYGISPAPQTPAVCPYITVSLTICFTSGRMGGTESYPFWNYIEGLDLRWQKWALDEIYESRDNNRGFPTKIWETLLWNCEW